MKNNSKILRKSGFFNILRQQSEVNLEMAGIFKERKKHHILS